MVREGEGARRTKVAGPGLLADHTEQGRENVLY